MRKTPGLRVTNQYYCDLPASTQQRMRSALRDCVQMHPEFKNKNPSGNLTADVILESIWNAAMRNV